MDKNLKNGILLISFAVLLFAIAIHIEAFLELISSFIGLLMPIIIGLIFAFILSVPMKYFENLLSKILKKNIDKKISSLSFLLTIVSLILIIAIVAIIVVPQLTKSVSELGLMIKEELPGILSTLKKYNFDVSMIEEWLKEFNISGFIQSLSGIFGNLISSIAKGTSAVLSGLSAFCVGTIIGIYILLDKKHLSEQLNRLLQAYLPKQHEKIIHAAAQFRKDFTNFLSGQCFEAIILGILITIVMMVLNIPYAGLIGVLTGFCAFIPYIGATLSLIIAAFLTLITAPDKAILCILSYLLTQFVETQFIYPRVVGSSVGLSPLLTLIAVFIGGSLFGVFGMIFFIPLTASIYALLKEDVAKRLKTPTF